MPVDLFAGIPVTDYAAALAWYERLFGSPPSFVPNDTEAVWELAEHRYVFVEQRPEHAGHARHLSSSTTSTRAWRRSPSGAWAHRSGQLFQSNQAATCSAMASGVEPGVE